MFDRNAIKQGFSRHADCYDAQAKLQQEIRTQATKLANVFFADGAKILDVGCGTGKFAQENNRWNVTSVDISYGMCKVAKENNIAAINADALALPFADNSFDGIFSSLALQWIEKPELVIKEILRVLKPEAVAIITTFVDGTLRELGEAFKVIDNFPHISNFADTEQLLLKTAHLGAKILEVDEQEYVTYHDDIISLMKSIKSIGASNKLSTRRKSLMTPAQLRKLENCYISADDNMWSSSPSPFGRGWGEGGASLHKPQFVTPPYGGVCGNAEHFQGLHCNPSRSRNKCGMTTEYVKKSSKTLIFEKEGKLPASWNVMTLVIGKAIT